MRGTCSLPYLPDEEWSQSVRVLQTFLQLGQEVTDGEGRVFMHQDEGDIVLIPQGDTLDQFVFYANVKTFSRSIKRYEWLQGLVVIYRESPETAT